MPDDLKRPVDTAELRGLTDYQVVRDACDELDSLRDRLERAEALVEKWRRPLGAVPSVTEKLHRDERHRCAELLEQAIAPATTPATEDGDGR